MRYNIQFTVNTSFILLLCYLVEVSSGQWMCQNGQENAYAAFEKGLRCFYYKPKPNYSMPLGTKYEKNWWKFDDGQLDTTLQETRKPPPLPRKLTVTSSHPVSSESDARGYVSESQYDDFYAQYPLFRRPPVGDFPPLEPTRHEKTTSSDNLTSENSFDENASTRSEMDKNATYKGQDMKQSAEEAEGPSEDTNEISSAATSEPSASNQSSSNKAESSVKQAGPSSNDTEKPPSDSSESGNMTESADAEEPSSVTSEGKIEPPSNETEAASSSDAKLKARKLSFKEFQEYELDPKETKKKAKKYHPLPKHRVDAKHIKK